MNHKKNHGITFAMMQPLINSDWTGFGNSSEPQAKVSQRIYETANLTFAHETMLFNMACVNLFPDSQYVTISIDTEKRRLIIEPTVYHDQNSLKFANFRKGKNVPRTCTTRIFCQMLFDFMQWNPSEKYRIPTIYQEFDDKKAMVFNLDEAEPVLSKSA